MEKGTTHSSEDPSIPANLIASKQENKLLDVNWLYSYQLAIKLTPPLD